MRWKKNRGNKCAANVNVDVQGNGIYVKWKSTMGWYV